MASTDTVDLEAMSMDFPDDEENITSDVSESDDWFDVAIGHIEDIIMDDTFIDLQNNFMEKNWCHFEDTEENKFIYTDIHKEYTELIESYIEDQLSLRMENFSMLEFQKQLLEKRDELDGEVFEMLLTFSDFIAFKEMFLHYRASKEGRTIDFSDAFTVTSLNSIQDARPFGRPMGDTNGSLSQEEPMVESLTPRGDEKPPSPDDI